MKCKQIKKKLVEVEIKKKITLLIRNNKNITFIRRINKNKYVLVFLMISKALEFIKFDLFYWI